MENKQADSGIVKQEVETTKLARNTDTNVSHLVVGIKQEHDNETKHNIQSQLPFLQEKMKQEQMYMKSEEITVNEGAFVATRNVDSLNDTKTVPVKVENSVHGGEDLWRHIKDEMCASTWSYFIDSHADVEKMKSSDSDLHSQHFGHDIVSEKLQDDIKNTEKTTENVGDGLDRQIVKQIRKRTGDVVDDLGGLPEHIHIEKNIGYETVSSEMMQVHKDNAKMKTENETGDLSLTSREQGLNESIQRLNESVKVGEYQDILEKNKTNFIHNDDRLSLDHGDCRNLSQNVICVSKKDTIHDVSSISSDEIYRCDVCGVVFITFDSLSNHKRKYKVEKHYKCDVCGKGFTHNSGLNKHTKIHTRGKHYKCDVCDKGFTRSDMLSVHKKIHTGEKPYKCNVCGKKFTQTSILNSHTKLHTGEKPYMCDVCGKGFIHKRSLNKHIKLHSGEKPHKCDVCGKGFNKKSCLNKHIKVHTGEKPHKCDVCGKGFTKSVNMEEHKIIHTGEKPHKCDICGKGFTQNSSLYQHTKIHTGEKPHKCDICGKKFTRSVHLKEHKIIHTEEKPHKCDVCGKGFTRSLNMEEHKIIHTGEKPHKCGICGKGFSYKSSFNKHIKIHTGEKPHKCGVCDKGFAQKANLKAHTKLHTG